MGLLTIEGTYDKGTIQLEEQPQRLEKARVLVTFLPETDSVRINEREAARQRAFARMKEGIDFGGQTFHRDELYEDRIQRLEERRGNAVE